MGSPCGEESLSDNVYYKCSVCEHQYEAGTDCSREVDGVFICHQWDSIIKCRDLPSYSDALTKDSIPILKKELREAQKEAIKRLIKAGHSKHCAGYRVAVNSNWTCAFECPKKI